MTKRRVLIVASNFPPVQSGGVYRTLRLAKYLPARGWELEVLTLTADRLPVGTQTDEGLLDEIPDSIVVHRARAKFPVETLNRWLGRDKLSAKREAERKVPSTETKKQSKNGSGKKSWAQNLKDMVTIPMQTPDRLVGWVNPAARSARKVCGQRNFDVIYSSGPPWSNHLVAQKASSQAGVPWVADFRDPWGGNNFRPDRAGDTWLGRKHRELEEGVYESADRVIFNTDWARRDAIERVGTQLESKSTVIPNGFDPAHFEDLCDQPSGLVAPSAEPRPIVLAHAGSFYGKRNVDSLLKAIHNLKVDSELSPSELRLELIGVVRDHERKLISEYSIGDVVSLAGTLPHDECLGRLRCADVLLLVQPDAPLCVPGKLYEYIAIGKPVLTLAGAGATADLVEREGLGVCVCPTDVDGIADALRVLVSQSRRGGHDDSNRENRDRYNGQLQMERFDQVFQAAIESHATAFSKASV